LVQVSTGDRKKMKENAPSDVEGGADWGPKKPNSQERLGGGKEKTSEIRQVTDWTPNRLKGGSF